MSLVLLLAISAFVLADRISIPHGTVDLVSKQESIQPGRSITLGLHFRLEKGWHIYWVNPGDSGEPLRLEWTLPDGLLAGTIEWPAPRRLPTPPLMDYGYEDEVLLPIVVETTSGLQLGGQVTLAADLKAIVCRDVCIPVKAHVSVSLPVRSKAPTISSQMAPTFRAAENALPKPAPSNWNPSVKDLGNEFELRVRTDHLISNAWFAPLDPQQIENAAPQKIVTTPAGLRLILKKSDQLSKPISKLRGVLVLESKGAYLIDAPVISSAATKGH
jgi:thiol:disulfide interchange protein DsbD